MLRTLWAISAVVLIGACAAPTESIRAAEPSRATAASGIDLQYVDPTVRPQDDAYRALNGRWLDTFDIPADKGRYGSFDQLRDATELRLKAIIDELATSGAGPGSEWQKIRDLYLSFMDEPTLEKLGTKPLAQEFARINAAKDPSDLASLIARFDRLRIDAPFQPVIHQDNRDSTRVVVDLRQGGLGMPDRDYYLDDKFSGIRTRYVAHIQKLLELAGERDTAASASEILKLETGLAKAQWTRVENRDPVKVYNRVEIARLPDLAPDFDWKRWLTDSGIDSRVDYVIVAQPSYITALSKLLSSSPLAVWKAYFKWTLLSDAAPYLAGAYVDESFAFQGTVVRGIPKNAARWKRGIELVEASIGQGLGKLYVARHFPPENLARIQKLVGNILAAYREGIDALEWMSPETKVQAQAKLAKIVPQIGYPTKWRDYSDLIITRDDLIGNRMRAQAFEYDRNLAKLGKPVDREEWRMTPQTVNAYYSRELNEVVFPAAILQPPFFNVAADDAVNYGAIGAVIGHEISHGFDDGGARYDGEGNLRQWFTPADLDKFRARTQALADQYDRYEPIPGFHVNGRLTLGENVADNSGLAIAYRAFKRSLGGKAAPILDGLSGEQRFYYAFIQVWRGKSRDPETIRRLKIDPHAPQAVRGYATLRNQPGFYEAFGIKEGDKMYLSPEQRVIVW